MEEIIKGLQILSKYSKSRDDVCAEHQYIFIDIKYSEISAEDQAALMDLGFTESDIGTVWCYT
jgi:hypothetical protein